MLQKGGKKHDDILGCLHPTFLLLPNGIAVLADTFKQKCKPLFRQSTSVETGTNHRSLHFHIMSQPIAFAAFGEVGKPSLNSSPMQELCAPPTVRLPCICCSRQGLRNQDSSVLKLVIFHCLFEIIFS